MLYSWYDSYPIISYGDIIPEIDKTSDSFETGIELVCGISQKIDKNQFDFDSLKLLKGKD